MLHRFVARRIIPPLVALLCASAAAAQNTATISGQVSDSASKAPLQGVEVFYATDATSPAIGSTRTNAEGRYTLANVAAGTFSVSARLVGFAPKTQRVTVAAGATQTVDFALGQR